MEIKKNLTQENSDKSCYFSVSRKTFKKSLDQSLWWNASGSEKHCPASKSKQNFHENLSFSLLTFVKICK